MVPLSQRSGVVEWCEGTVPFGVYLVHPKEGAHVRYNPHDWPNNTCRKRMEVSLGMVALGMVILGMVTLGMVTLGMVTLGR